METNAVGFGINPESIKKIRSMTRTSVSLHLINPSKGKKNNSRVSREKGLRPLKDDEILNLLWRGDDAKLEEYIGQYELSEEVQKYLIKGHKLKLIRLYIKKYGFCRSAQSEFLDFMEERLLR